MSRTNESPLDLASWSVAVKLAEDLHAQNSERFVNYEKKSD